MVLRKGSAGLGRKEHSITANVEREAPRWIGEAEWSRAGIAVKATLRIFGAQIAPEGPSHACVSSSFRSLTCSC